MATIFENPDFDAEAASKTLKESMDGLGTNEEPICQVLTNHTSEQRMEICRVFKASFGETLEDELKSELGGHFEMVVMALMTEPVLYDVRELKEGMKGAGTEEKSLIEIMCSRESDVIDAIEAKYIEEYDKTLEEAFDSDCSGHFQRFLVSQLHHERDAWTFGVDEDKAAEDAQALFEAGEGQTGTDESVFNSILCTRSFEQLDAIFRKYAEIAGRDIEDSIRSECTGNVEAGFLGIVEYTKSPARFFAKRLREALSGAGTDDRPLIRIIVSRSEIDLENIKQVYEEDYGHPLCEAIDSDCRGNYKDILKMIVK